MGAGSVGHDRRDQRSLARSRKRLLSRRHLVERRAQSEDVRPRIRVLAFELLRRHVLERPEDRPFLSQRGLRRQFRQAPLGRRRLEGLRQAEVEQLHARLRQHHVARLQVPVHDPLPVRLVERVRHLAAPYRSVCSSGSGPFASRSDSVSPFEKLHHEVLGLALSPDVVERADVRMRELRDRLRLPLEPLPRLRETTTGATAAPSPPPSARAACPAPCTPRPSRPRRAATGSRRGRGEHPPRSVIGFDSDASSRHQRDRGLRLVADGTAHEEALAIARDVVHPLAGTADELRLEEEARNPRLEGLAGSDFHGHRDGSPGSDVEELAPASRRTPAAFRPRSKSATCRPCPGRPCT